jgi:hypothetical protein
MSNEIRQTELREKTQQLLQGPLKHIRAAALLTRGEQRGRVERRVDDRRTAAHPDGYLQQRPALRTTSPVAPQCPMPLNGSSGARFDL